MYICICVYIYIYIYIHRLFYKESCISTLCPVVTCPYLCTSGENTYASMLLGGIAPLGI